MKFCFHCGEVIGKNRLEIYADRKQNVWCKGSPDHKHYPEIHRFVSEFALIWGFLIRHVSHCPNHQMECLEYLVKMHKMGWLK